VNPRYATRTHHVEEVDSKYDSALIPAPRSISMKNLFVPELATKKVQ
jgi:hypothetical protein